MCPWKLGGTDIYGYFSSSASSSGDCTHPNDLSCPWFWPNSKLPNSNSNLQYQAFLGSFSKCLVLIYVACPDLYLSVSLALPFRMCQATFNFLMKQAISCLLCSFTQANSPSCNHSWVIVSALLCAVSGMYGLNVRSVSHAHVALAQCKLSWLQHRLLFTDTPAVSLPTKPLLPIIARVLFVRFCSNNHSTGSPLPINDVQPHSKPLPMWLHWNIPELFLT